MDARIEFGREQFFVLYVMYSAYYYFFLFNINVFLGSFSGYKGKFCTETIYKSANLLKGDIILVLLAQWERVLFQTGIRN